MQVQSQSQSQIERYYKERMSRGRGGLARAIDFIALRLLIMCGGYIWFRGMGLASYVSVFLGAIVVTLVSIGMKLYRGIAMERFIERERASIAIAQARFRLLSMSADEFLAVAKRIMREDGIGAKGFGLACESGASSGFSVGADGSGDTDGLGCFDSCDSEVVWLMQRAAELDEQAVLEVYRGTRGRGGRQAIIFNASDVSEKGEEMMKRLSGEVEFKVYAGEEIAERGGVLSAVSEEEIDEVILQRAGQRRRKLKEGRSQVFSSTRARPYLILGVVLFVLSFVAGGGMYYRVLASIAFGASGLAFFLSRRG